MVPDSVSTIVRAVALMASIFHAGQAWAVIAEADFASDVLLGCHEATCTSGSTNATANIYQEGNNTYTIRFGLNFNADDSAGGGLVLENGVANYATNFTIDLDNYDLILSCEYPATGHAISTKTDSLSP